MRKQAVHLLPCPCKVPLQIAKQFIAKIENAAIFIRRFEGAPIGNGIRAFRLRSEQTTFADKFRPCGIILSNLQIDKPLFHSGKRTKIFRISFVQESDRLQGKRRIAVLQGFQEKSPTTANHLFRRRRKRENRLFDRDTLLLQHYDINFLFVLSLYAQSNDGLKAEFRERTRRKFRENILQYLGDTYQFYSLQLKPRAGQEEENEDDEQRLDAMHRAIEKHFRSSIGKVFRPYSDEKFMYVAVEPKEEFYEDNLQLLSELSKDFTIRHYKLNTNPTDEINKFYQIEAELSGVEAVGTKVLKGEKLRLEDFADEMFLVGGWRKDKNQLVWIKEHMMYNVRRRVHGENRNGVQRIEKGLADAHYLLLYEIGADMPSYELYRIDSYKVRETKWMEKNGYPEPSGKYIVYRLESMPKEFGRIDLDKVLKNEMAKAVREHQKRKEDYGPKDFEGTPVYLTGREIMEIIK